MANAAFSTAFLFGFTLLIPFASSEAQGLAPSAPTKEFIYFNNRLIAVEQRGPAGSPDAVRAKSPSKSVAAAGAAAAGSSGPDTPAAKGGQPPTTPPPPLPVPGSSPTVSDNGARYRATTPAYTHAAYAAPK